MKKLMLALMGLVCLTACNKELGPEYKTGPVIGDVYYAPAAPKASDQVTVSVPISCEYGLYAAQIAYWLNDDATTASQYTSPYYFTSEPQSATFNGTIPKQAAGTKVSFSVIATSPYNVLTYSKVYTYTVASEVEPTSDEN